MFATSGRLLMVLGLVLLAAMPSRADVGLIVLEPVDALGFFTRVGHAGTYFSNICPDGSPVRMRLCRPGEHGGVVSKYAPLSEHENYDWAIVPFEEFMHGFGSPELAPLIGTPKLQAIIERYKFTPLFSLALKSATPDGLPAGQWRAALATRFDRTLYIYSVETSITDDAALVAAFNAAPNKSRFNFFYRNCSDQARGIFDLILPDIEGIGDRTSGVTMQTPKGLAKALVARASKYPELHLQVRRYPQIPGTYARSRDVLFPMENTYKSIAYAPWWFFGGFREVALASMFYHQVLSPFGTLKSSRDFISPRVANLTLEQGQLRQRQDEIRAALALAESHGSGWSRLAELNARIVRRLADITDEKRAEVTRISGSKARWEEIDRGFQAMLFVLRRQPFLPEALERHVTHYQPGVLSQRLVEYFEANGTFSVNGDGPWISLPLAGGDTASTGLSTSRILSGDRRLAVLVLSAAIDYHLHQTEARREDLAYVEELFGLFKQATEAIQVPVRKRTAPAMPAR